MTLSKSVVMVGPAKDGAPFFWELSTHSVIDGPCAKSRNKTTETKPTRWKEWQNAQ